MTGCFADTSYFLAILNRRDANHAKAEAVSATLSVPILTTAWVLVEVANSMAAPPLRSRFIVWHRTVRASDVFRIIGPDAPLLDRGLDLYARRPDKAWSLTDCISFVVMQDHGLTEALTADRHFEQAGFKALLC